MNPIRIPDDTRSLHAIGNYIMNFEVWQNAFVNALVNRVGLVMATSKLWNNKWAWMKRGTLELGETVEEVFVNIAKVFSYDPATAEKQWMKRENPDVRAAFHTMNWQKFYKITTEYVSLRQCFLTWGGINDLLARIVEQLYAANNYDEYITEKYMLCRSILNGDITAVVNPVAINTTAGKQNLIAMMRGYSNDFEFESSKYNMAGVYNYCEKANQHYVIDNFLSGEIDVEVLAAAFNMEKAEFMGHMHTINGWDEHDNARLAELFANDSTYTPFTSGEISKLASVQCLLCDRDFPMIFDNVYETRRGENGEGMYWQHWLHSWKTFSLSPFANALVIVETSTVTSVTVSPASVTLSAGGQQQFTATVAGTGIFSKNVTWSISGQVSSDTHIDGYSGVLVIGADEPNGTITVTGMSVQDNTKTGTSTVTVS